MDTAEVYELRPCAHCVGPGEPCVACQGAGYVTVVWSIPSPRHGREFKKMPRSRMSEFREDR
jgi:hypothetical protein